LSARVSHGFLLAGLAVAAACLWALPWPLVPLLEALACAAAVGAVLAGIRTHAPEDAVAWRALGGFLAAFAVSYLVFVAAPAWGGFDPYPAASDLASLAGYVLLVVALVRLARGGTALGTLVDLAIVAAAATMAVGVFLLEPVLPRLADDPAQRALALIYPIANVVVAAALLRFLLAGGARARAGRLRRVGRQTKRPAAGACGP